MFGIKTGDSAKLKTDLLVVMACEDDTSETVSDDPVIQTLFGQVGPYPEFGGRGGDELMLYTPGGAAATRVLFMGLGKREKINPESFRCTAGKAVSRAIKAKLKDVVFHARGEKENILGMMEGACLANYCFDHYKKEKKQQVLSDIFFHVDKSRQKALRSAAQGIETVCRGTILAREWVSAPPNDKRPDMFARSIVKAADKENITIVDLDERNIRKNKMHAMLGVGAGSDARPRMVVLDYRPEKYSRTIVLVGKGVTFDSGGINLKPSNGLADMKQDMAGAAAVAATLITASRLEMTHRIIGVLPLVENMPSGSAYRPGDVIKTASGKTVEIGNTDAEGRLILADAISYAIRQYKPDTLLDIATLTGACKIALGPKIAGVFSPSDDLAARIVASGVKTHERCWAMPLPPDYRDMLKSDIADLRNVGKSRWGGAIAAALFLSSFTENVDWAHIDIAGPAYAESANAYCPAGGTGFGVRLFIDWLGSL